MKKPNLPVRTLETPISRRSVLGGSLALLATSATPAVLQGQQSTQQSASSFNLLRQPDLVQIMSGVEPTLAAMSRNGTRWSVRGAELQVAVVVGGADLSLTAPALPVHRIHLRWRGKLHETTQVTGDAWERSYGDLAWLPLRAERPLPGIFCVRVAAPCRVRV